jgi:KipI family sensor histidine kinase inhibitor
MSDKPSALSHQRSSFVIRHPSFVIRHSSFVIMRYQPFGDSALNIKFGDSIDPEINLRVHAYAESIQQKPFAGFIECVPTYCALLIHYDPLQITYTQLIHWLNTQLPITNYQLPITNNLIEIPTRYDGEDLEFVAHHHQLTIAQVIELHSATEYRVYMMGFTPGFAYMGKLNSQLVTPRLESPRKLVKAGSVGIAGEQTGIYPIDSPGGWRLIGRTHVELFNLDRDPPFLFSPNDRVKFTPVESSTF